MSEEQTPQASRNITPKNLLDALIGEPTSYEPIKVQKLLKTRAQVKKAMAQRLEKAVDRRDMAKEKMLRIHAGMNQPDKNIHWLNLQLENLRRCYDEVERSYLEICDAVPRDQREDFKLQNIQIEEMYDHLYVNIQSGIAEWKAREEQSKLNALAPAYNPPQQPTAVSNMPPHLHVPLPTFDGNLENWYSFKCMFQTIMGRYPNESTAIKLYHLKNALVGSAAGKIDQDVINNNDYSAAWKMLEDAYEDERLIIDTHIDALLSLPKMTAENGEELRKLIDTCTKHVDALKNRQLPVEGLAEMILVNVIAKRLDKETRKLWESQLAQDELPAYAEMIDYLRERVRILQKMTGYAEPRTTLKPKNKPEQKIPQARNFVQTKEVCHCCNGDHLIYKCGQFKELNVSSRYAKVKQAGLCFNCLRRGHRTVDCNSERSCKSCKRKHHSLLHDDKPVQQSSSAPSEQPAKPEERQEVAVQAGSVNCATSLMLKQQVLLSTAEVLVAGSGNVGLPCRVLLDSGSDSNLISEAFAKRLNLPMENINLPISGLNNAETRVKFKLTTKISSRVNPFNAILDFLVVPTITTNLPMMKVDIRSWSIPTSVDLADPSFHVPKEIQMIIGAELFFVLVKNGRMKLAEGAPMLVETDLGWVVSGPVKGHSSGPQGGICQLNLREEQINHTLVKFWELETVQEASPLTSREQAIEKHFEQTHFRDDTGRFTVRLPFNDNKGQLGDSLETARSRFDWLPRSFANKTKLKRYSEFMTEYQALGHMVEVFDNPVDCYFLPHHAVYKESSTTTKIRVVFDASAKTSSGLSLNDALDVGPTVQKDLITILLRFCCFPVVLTADIPKMYRQVQIHKDDRKYQRILWLTSTNEVGTFELTTVTYGCSSAPYLATRALMQLAKDETSDLPVAAKVVEENSYIDDFLTGGNTTEEVIEIYEQLTEMLRRGGFGVHKFCSNQCCEVVRSSIPTELQESQVKFEDADINNAIKTLGLIWNQHEDYFRFNVAPLDEKVPTKRSVLSAVGLLFDPCGYLGPVITTAKMLMQDLWRLKLKWDDELPEEPRKMWIDFRRQLPLVNTLQKKRCVVRSDTKQTELHGFADASLRAYGAVLYTRCISPDGTVEVNLVCSKSRVAPLKPMTIPRLELCGALLLARLVDKTVAAMGIPFKSVTLHLDSQVVLCWLEKSPLALNQFVSNRVAEILELTQTYQWQYVRSEQNPADLISRGVLPAEISTMDLWWDSSPFLWELDPKYNDERIKLSDNEVPELKPTVVVATTVQAKPLIVMTRLSNFRRLHRAWAYVLRFCKNVRTKNRDTLELKAQEMADALHAILKQIQKEEFRELFRSLAGDEAKRNRYSGLAPFIDTDGLIRVGGRLKYSSIPYDGRHQILLPEKHHVTAILIQQLHEDNFHVGQRGLLSIVRERYWPINAQMLIKKIISKCHVCCRHNPRPVAQYMGNLPDYRITPAPVFSNTGIDYAGPIFLKEAGRKTVVYKAYICVFVCMATKAIHMEVVSNLTAGNFIAALQRFISRRGMVANIYSDNGTTFVGANHELAALRQLFEDQATQRKLADFCISKGIQWHFIPPRSPHFGGIWEAGVKSVKHHLKRVVGETKLTFEEVSTFLAQCEAILNSRPLIPVSNDPNDVEVLTPSHFLIQRPALSIPEPSYDEVKIGRLVDLAVGNMFS
ncbi:uncharacterized protein LOC134290521 [Aedes albopictus]|uniref:Endonuclease n=1 Tax=Aedes albopictus TaxID=7160 RepID=A0ABM1ZZR2_AEDAL